MFHNAMARFKRMRLTCGAVAAPKTSFAETADEMSSEESTYDFVVEDIGATTRPYASRNDIAAMERRHDSVVIATTEQAATNSKIHTLTPRPQKKDLRSSLAASGYFKQQPNAPCTIHQQVSRVSTRSVSKGGCMVQALEIFCIFAWPSEIVQSLAEI